jgi:eukaryotic-like serine/threonine-protein kinase
MEGMALRLGNWTERRDGIMTLAAGTRFGPHEILNPIGAGGMGEVYRARDTRLGRDVAIKVLPDSFATDARRRAQFEHEAHLLASLNHPHIAQVYGLEETAAQPGASVLALVMELVDGDTIAQRIARGPIPVDEAIGLFQQVAAALDAAHAKGIVHRDLKPANIKVTRDGHAKVLDFGIARTVDLFQSGGSELSTIAATVWSDGTPGTPAYMSPEQIGGRPVDRRTDIWAFGCCLYQALTGSRPFEGSTVAETFAAILTQEPDWSALPKPTPAPVRLLVRRCLHKDPDRRLRDVGDAWIDNSDWTAVVPSGEIQSRHGVGAVAARVLPWLLASVIAATAVLVGGRSRPSASGVRHLSLVLPESTALALASAAPVGEGRPSIALSPDGGTLVYAGIREGQVSLYEQRFDRGEPHAIPGTAGAFNPFFSPDGRWVGFFASDTLKKVGLSGQNAVTLCRAPNPYGAVWHPEGRIYFASSFGRSIMRVSENGGTPESIVESPVQGYVWPELLPDGTNLLATRLNEGVVSLSIKSGKEKVLLREGTHAKYLPTGDLIFVKESALFAVPFDATRLAVSGDTVPVLGSIRTESHGGGQFSVANDGTLAYVPGTSAAAGTLVSVDRAGKQTPLDFPVATYGTFQLATDGKRLVIDVQGPTHDLWLFNLVRSVRTRLTFEGNNTYPIWSSDGRSIIFASDRTDGIFNLFRVRADAPQQVERLVASPVPHRPHSASRDGKWLVFSESIPGDAVVAVASLLDRGTKRVTRMGFKGSLMALSPDQRWLAYTSEESGRSEVYLRDFPDALNRTQVSTEGGEEPVWSPNGDELFYRNGEEWMTVSIQLVAPVPTVGRPVLLFRGDYLNVPGRSYDVMPDGQSFILIRRTADTTPTTQLNVVLNWFEELRRSLPER